MIGELYPGEFEAMEHNGRMDALEQEPCEDAISRQAVCNIIDDIRDCVSVNGYWAFLERLKKLPSVNPLSKDYNTIYYTPQPKTGHCKECKWWKDKDGVYRRGIGAESKCPINCREVFEGNGYCYMFEPQETETWNGIHAQITAPKGTFERIFNDADDENDI
jgi:hypothetical protein